MFTIGRESLPAPATDFRAALLMELLKATPLAPPPMISPEEQEKRMRQVGWTAAPPADSPPRRVVRELPNSDLRLKSVSACRSTAAKATVLATLPLRLQEQQRIQAPRSHKRAQVFCSRDRKLLIPSRDRLANAPCLCFYRPRRNWSALWFPHRARPSAFSRALRPAFVRKCRRAARARLRPR